MSDEGHRVLDEQDDAIPDDPGPHLPTSTDNAAGPQANTGTELINQTEQHSLPAPVPIYGTMLSYAYGAQPGAQSASPVWPALSPLAGQQNVSSPCQCDFCRRYPQYESSLLALIRKEQEGRNIGANFAAMYGTTPTSSNFGYSVPQAQNSPNMGRYNFQQQRY